MKNVLITGATSGIGRALTFRFAEKGYHLILIARSQNKLDQLSLELEKKTVNAEYICLDLKSTEEVQKLPETYTIDCLVNCAGVGEIGDFQKITMRAELELLQVNLLAPVTLSKLYAQQFVQQGSGVIINICSTAAFYPNPYLNSYSSSKAALFNYSLGLYEELQVINKKIRVLTICPGPTKTHFFKGKVNPEFNDNKIASKFQMSPQCVADLIIKELLYERPYRILGYRNRLGTFLIRCLPTKTRVKLVANYIRKGVM